MSDAQPILDGAEPWQPNEEPLAAYLLRNATSIEAGAVVTADGMTALAGLSFVEMAAGHLPRGLAALGLLHRALDAIRDEGLTGAAFGVSGRLATEARDALGWGQKGIPALIRTNLPRDAALRLIRMGLQVRLVERLPGGVTPESAAAATEGIVIRSAEDVAILEAA